MPDEPLPLSQVLLEEYVRLHGPLDDQQEQKVDSAQNEAERLQAVFAAIHALKDGNERTAFCISGGGIRSATYALGVIQRLADFGLLRQFHYLTTISGGGYIGSWLSSFIRRNPEGTPDVEKEISPERAPHPNPLEPEIEPLTWLRRFSNYLTPQLGLLSGDTWAFAGSYVRNLLLVWLMFVPFLAAFLALPRLAIALLRVDLNSSNIPEWSAAIAAVLIFIGTAVIAFTRPVSYRTPGWLTNGRFQRYVLIPYVLAAMLMVFYWAARYATFDNWPLVIVALMSICLLSTIVYMIRFWYASLRERATNVRSDTTKEGYIARKAIHEIIAGQVAALVAGGLLYASSWLFHEPLPFVKVPTLLSWQTIPPSLSQALGEVFLCFGVPLVLGILFVQSAVFVGISSWFNEEYDREWWGRAGGWVVLAGVLWIAITLITVFGPVAIYQAPRIFSAFTAVTGAISILLGRSSRTSANAKEQGEKSTSQSLNPVNLILGLIAPLFAICVLALISLCTSLLLLSIDPPKRIEELQLARALSGTYSIHLTKELPPGWSFHSSGLPAAEKDRIHSIEHLWTIDRTTVPEGLILVFGLAAFSWIVSFFIGANQFSMHGLYRNRLIRCYLGASRFRGRKSNTNAFSGFDPSDNLPMHRMRPELFWGSSFNDIHLHGPRIISDVQLASYIHWATEHAVADAVADPNSIEACRRAGDLLAEDLNRALDDLELAEPGPWPQSIVNRRALDTRFPGAFRTMDSHLKPLHLIGMTLNLVESRDLAWQERKGSSFTVSPLHAGSLRLGYRPTRMFGGPTGVSLGTAVAISGAAVSPNMGYNSSPALSFLLTLFNVRLGWWYGNPKKPSYGRANPSNTLTTILSEAFGLTTDDHDSIYLSDGGHFDNLGLYEAVLRRCRCIVVTDAAGDESFAFSDFGNAVRKIRIDFGIDIEMKQMFLFPRDPEPPAGASLKVCAVGDIRYDLVDPGAPKGKLLYIKPAYYGKREPRDVCAYATKYPTFPHESTGDQWYSESQFESYRQLGYHSIGELANGKKTFSNVAELIREAEEYVRKP